MLVLKRPPPHRNLPVDNFGNEIVGVLQDTHDQEQSKLKALDSGSFG